jgi:xylulokinase
MKTHSPPYFLTIDAGTTSIKASLFDKRIKHIKSIVKEYPLLTPTPEKVELSPEQYWINSCRAVRELLKQVNIKKEKIKAVSISSQGETFITVDKKGRPLDNAIVWLDNRAEKETEIIKKKISLNKFFKTTGIPEIVPSWPICKILWLRKNKPFQLKKTEKILLVEDSLIYKLTGEYITEKSLQSTSGYFNIIKGRWWEEALEIAGIKREQLPVLLGSGTIVGKIKKDTAREVGLNVNTLVVTGAMDQTAAAIGAGNISEGIITETTGTAMVLASTVKKPIYDQRKRLSIYYHALDNRYLLLAYSQTAGMVLKWFKDEFCGEEVKAARRKNKDVYDILTDMAKDIAPGSDGVIMLPYLTGVTSPEFNPKAKGVISGLTLGAGKAHIIRAILESVAYSLRANIEIFKEIGLPVKSVKSLGGAGKSKLWNQIKADIINVPINTNVCEEASSLGVALIAAVSCGIFSDIKTAVKKTIRTKDIYVPIKKHQKAYEIMCEKQKDLYFRLKSFFK